MAAAPHKDDVSSKLANLDLSKANPLKEPAAKKDVADSWEDEDVSDSEPTTPIAAAAAAAAASSSSSSAHETPRAPPPTPSTPLFGSSPAGWESGRQSPARNDGRRPEKTDAVARRLIAAGLGLKAPKQTDEQRAFEKSVRDQERKRRDQERAEQQQKAEAAEKAKAAVWDD